MESMGRQASLIWGKYSDRSCEVRTELSETEKMLDAYNKFKQDILDGKYGKTSQFWVIMHLSVIRNVYLLHRADQEKIFPSPFWVEKISSVGICFE